MYLIAKNMNLNYTMKRNISISIVLLVLFSSCSYIKKQKAAKKMQEYTEYKDLHKHQGTKQYDVITLFKDNFIIEEKLIENKQKIISLLGENEKDILRQKVDFFGNVKNKKEYWYRTLQEGTLWTGKHYLNWLLNNDEIEHKYIDPFTNQEIEDHFKFKNTEKDFKKWFLKFKEFYKNSQYIYIYMSYYYFKRDNKWYIMEASYYDQEPKNFRDHYPAKINPEEIRMVELTESMEPLMKQGVIKVVAYIEQDSESGVGLNPINFSSGYYMLELHLPQGDTLKFRRYGAMGVSSEMFVYQIPKELGGSNEVFFIEQEPNEMYPDKSFAGFYAIRPKNYTTLPEYQPYLKKEQQDSLQKRRSFLPNK